MCPPTPNLTNSNDYNGGTLSGKEAQTGSWHQSSSISGPTLSSLHYLGLEASLRHAQDHDQRCGWASLLQVLTVGNKVEGGSDVHRVGSGNRAPVGLLDSAHWQAEVMQVTTTAAVLPVWRSRKNPGLDVPLLTCYYAMTDYLLDFEEENWRSSRFIGLN